jgi:hypothetical protein
VTARSLCPSCNKDTTTINGRCPNCAAIKDPDWGPAFDHSSQSSQTSTWDTLEHYLLLGLLLAPGAGLLGYAALFGTSGLLLGIGAIALVVGVSIWATDW